MEKQNVVYFVADQLRWDALHCMGNAAAHTPNLDAFCKESVAFSNSYCQNPVCVPSRCSFLTGLYPHTLGHRTMHFLQSADEPNLLKTMKENGYEVIWCGRNDVIPIDRDMTAYCDEHFSGKYAHRRNKPQGTAEGKEQREGKSAGKERYSFYTGDTTESGSHTAMDEQVVDYAMEYLEKRKNQKEKKPVFLYVTLGMPHPPYGCGRPYYGTTDRCGIWERRPDLSKTVDKPSMLHGIHEKQGLADWEEGRWAELRATYLDMVYHFDTMFGRLREKLIETDMYENSNIFVFSDHGDYTGDYGIVEKAQNCFDDPVCRVPLFIRPAKGHAVKPRITGALAELVDLNATVADLTGISLNYTQFGCSLKSVLAGNESHREEVHCEGGRIHGEVQCMERGHGPESPYWPRLSTQESEGPEHTKAVMLRNERYKYVKRLYEKDEFYDLERDPMELHNCVDEPKYQEVIRQFQGKLVDFMLETTDYVPNRKDRRY